MGALQAAAHPGPELGGNGQKDRPVGHGGGEKVQHTHRIAPVEGGGLGHIADNGTALFTVGALEVNGPGVGELAQDGLEEGGLARPVGPDEGHDLPAVEVEGHIPQKFGVPQGDSHVLHLQAAQTGTAGGAVLVFADAHSILTCPSLSPLMMAFTFSRMASV